MPGIRRQPGFSTPHRTRRGRRRSLGCPCPPLGYEYSGTILRRRYSLRTNRWEKETPSRPRTPSMER